MVPDAGHSPRQAVWLRHHVRHRHYSARGFLSEL